MWNVPEFMKTFNQNQVVLTLLLSSRTLILYSKLLYFTTTYIKVVHTSQVPKSFTEVALKSFLFLQIQQQVLRKLYKYLLKLLKYKRDFKLKLAPLCMSSFVFASHYDCSHTTQAISECVGIFLEWEFILLSGCWQSTYSNINTKTLQKLQTLQKLMKYVLKMQVYEKENATL